MTLIREYNTGYRDFCSLKHIIKKPEEGMNEFYAEFKDVELRPFDNVLEVFADNLSNARKPVEILYSGGMDSEAAMRSCQINNIPFKAITMRLNIRGCPINTHDLYYSEKFCRENNIEQKIVDLPVGKFFKEGTFLDYLKPYNITVVHVATHFWLIEQCDSFPILGGDWPWPQLGNGVYSPYNHNFAFYDIFMRDNSISGIGNFLSHSLESCLFLIKAQLDVQAKYPDTTGGDNLRIITLKQKMIEQLGLGNLELRHRSYGWEMHKQFKSFFYLHDYTRQAAKEFNLTKNTIIWNKILGDAIGAAPGSHELANTFLEKKMVSFNRDVFDKKG